MIPENAVATCCAEAPSIPAVKVNPAIARTCPASNAVNLTSALSVVALSSPCVTTIVGALLTTKSVTFVFGLVLVKVTALLPLFEPVLQSPNVPLVNVPPLVMFVIELRLAAVA